MKRNGIIIMAMFCCVATVVAEDDSTATLISIYLPRETKVSVGQMTIGTFAVVRCSDETIAAKVSAIAMGRAPWSNDQVLIDRQTILSRLASEGFSADQLQLTGALEVVITRNELTISADQLIAAANTFLSGNPMDTDRMVLKLSRPPQDIVVPAGDGLTFQAHWADSAPDGHVAVQISLNVGGQTVGQRTLLFRMFHLVRKIVTTKDIQPGETISPQNTKIVVEESLAPQAADWSPPYGTQARAFMAAGVDVRNTVIKDEAAPITITRNAVVLLKVEGPGFVLTCAGQALQDGRTGDLIRVRNMDSKRVIVARIMPDGSVQPANAIVVLEVSK